MRMPFFLVEVNPDVPPWTICKLYIGLDVPIPMFPETVKPAMLPLPPVSGLRVGQGTEKVGFFSIFFFIFEILVF